MDDNQLILNALMTPQGQELVKTMHSIGPMNPNYTPGQRESTNVEDRRNDYQPINIPFTNRYMGNPLNMLRVMSVSPADVIKSLGYEMREPSWSENLANKLKTHPYIEHDLPDSSWMPVEPEFNQRHKFYPRPPDIPSSMWEHGGKNPIIPDLTLQEWQELLDKHRIKPANP